MVNLHEHSLLWAMTLFLYCIILFVLETLSGFRKTPLDGQKFHSVVDNYIRHAPKKSAVRTDMQ